MFRRIIQSTTSALYKHSPDTITKHRSVYPQLSLISSPISSSPRILPSSTSLNITHNVYIPQRSYTSHQGITSFHSQTIQFHHYPSHPHLPRSITSSTIQHPHQLPNLPSTNHTPIRQYTRPPSPFLKPSSSTIRTPTSTTTTTTASGITRSFPHASHVNTNTIPLIHIPRRFKSQDWVNYYLYRRRSWMRYRITRRGLVRPGRKNHTKHFKPRFFRRFLKLRKFKRLPRFIKNGFKILFGMYCILYVLPFLLRWQYDLNPRSLTRFDLLDFAERWEHKIISDLRMYRLYSHLKHEAGSVDTGVTLYGQTTPIGKPFRQGLLYYYFLFAMFPTMSGMLDPLLFPRMFFFGFQSMIPESFADPLIPQNVLITMSIKDLTKFLSILQTRIYLATNSGTYEGTNVNGERIVYDPNNNIEEYKLRTRRYRYSQDFLNELHKMVAHEVFRRIYTGVFYSGRESIVSAPQIAPPLPTHQVPESVLEGRFTDEHVNVISTPIPGLASVVEADLLDRNGATGNIFPFNILIRTTHTIKHEMLQVSKEVLHFASSIVDRLTWTGYKTGLENIEMIHLDEVSPLDFRLHDFKRSKRPLFMIQIHQKLAHLHNILFTMFFQFADGYRSHRDVLDNFKFPAFRLNSDIDEIIFHLTAPDLPKHYKTMLRALTEIDHSHQDYEYDYRRVNLGILYDRQFKLRQNIELVGTVISVIQEDIASAKALARSDGVQINEKQLGYEWTLYDLMEKHREMQRVLNDIDIFLSSDAAHEIDPNVEPVRGDRGIIAKALGVIPGGVIVRNVLRRSGLIERGSIPLDHIISSKK